MLRKLMAPALAASLVLAACDSSPTEVSANDTDDYALVMFGEAGSALEGTMGEPPPGGNHFDGRSGWAPLPDSLALTQTQRDSINLLRAAFRTAHQAQLDSLRSIFAAARTARLGGATREEVREILETGRPIAQALRPDLEALRSAIRAVLTEAQRAWIDTHRPRRFPRPIAPPRP